MSPSATPSIKEEDSRSSFEPNASYSYDCTINTQQDRLVVGPDGNKILCDSPDSSGLPPYAATDDMSPRESRDDDSSSKTTKQRSSLNNNVGNTSNSKRSLSAERAKPRRIIGNYTLINTLGSGSMGKVRLAVHNITGNKLAAKIVPRKQLKKDGNGKKREKDEHREVRTIREASIMLLLHHPFIVSVKEMVILDPYYYLFMEYVNGGQLLDYIISHGKLKEKQARRFGRQIVSALDYCHRNSIVHRDLKIENILISQSGNIKIIDFGLSNLFSPRSSLNTFCGSLYFAAPELLNAKSYTGPEVDVWSFGVVLYVLVCGKVPFDDQNMPALHEKIKRGVVDYPSHLSTDCKSILSRMLVTNPAHRATISEIIIHPWMNKGYDGPIDNYLPDRIPLSLPIDMDVVRGMTGFEFGTEIDIRDKLTNIITSREYQEAAKKVVERTAETHRNHKQFSSSSRFSPHSISNKKSFVLPNEDPQTIPAAYHPLVSIYYLVKERIEREKRLAAQSDEHLLPPDVFTTNTSSPDNLMSTPDSNSSIRIPDISLPENAHPGANILTFEQSLFGDPQDMFGHTTTGVAYDKKGKINIRVDEDGHVIASPESNKRHTIEHGLSRLFSRQYSNGNNLHNSNQSSEFDSDDEYDLHRSSSRGGDPNNVLRRLSLALSRSSTERKPRPRKSSANYGDTTTTAAVSTSTPIQIPSCRDNNDKLSKSHLGPNQPATKFPNSIEQTDIEIATAAAAAVSAAAANSASNNSFGNTISKMLPRRMTLGQPSMNAENHTNFLNVVHGHHNQQQQQSSAAHESRLVSNKAPVKTLPLHIDTSNDITDSKDIHYQRNQYIPDRYKQHSHEQSFPSAADGSTGFQQQGTADEQIKPVFLKGLFSVTTTSTKHPSVIRADLIRVLERIGVKWRESKGRFECVHVPSIDLNRVVLDEDNATVEVSHNNQSFSSEDNSVPSSAIPLPDLVVRFEIYIVKVPWLLGMHGLQFRRVGGDPWQYKNMCSKILAELKL